MKLRNRLLLGLLIITVLLIIIFSTVQPGIFQSFLLGVSVFITISIVTVFSKRKGNSH